MVAILSVRFSFPLDETRQHSSAYVVSLLFQHFKIFLDRVKFRLKDLLLHLQKLWYLAELIVRHYHAVIVVVLDLVEEVDAVVCLETYCCTTCSENTIIQLILLLL